MSGLPTGLLTIPTRRHAPFHLANSIPLTIHLPPETLAAIFSFATTNAHSLRNANPLSSSALVSKIWNVSSTPFLYRHLHVADWDSRIGTTLLATLERHPTLLSHVRSLKTSYPRFKRWDNGSCENMFIGIYDQVLEEQLGLLDADGRALEEADLRATGGPHPATEAETERVCREMVLSDIEAKAAGRWMDKGPNGDSEAPRRMGACALIQLASRCPRLGRLELDQFDFGDGTAERLEPLDNILPSSLPSIRSLSLTRIGTPTTTHDLISRMPNLEELEIDVFPVLQGTPLWSTLPQLHHLDLGRLGLQATVGALLLLSRPGMDALRSLSITLEKGANFLLPQLLVVRPSLEALTLAPSGKGSLPLHDLCDFLQSNSSLRSLIITADLTSHLVTSLPTSLVRLIVDPSESNERSPNWSDVDDIQVLEALIVSKRDRTPHLCSVTLEPFEYSFFVEKAVREVVEAGVIVQFHPPGQGQR